MHIRGGGGKRTFTSNYANETTTTIQNQSNTSPCPTAFRYMPHYVYSDVLKAWIGIATALIL